MLNIRTIALFILVLFSSAAMAEGIPDFVKNGNFPANASGSAPHGAEYYAKKYAGGPPDQKNFGPSFLVSNSLYKGEDDNLFIPIPLLYYKVDRFLISGLTAKYEVVSDRFTTLSAFGQWRFDGYKPGDSTFLAGMEQRKRGFDGGLELKLSNRASENVTFSFATDLSGNHKGNEIKLSYGKTFRNNRTIITPTVGVKLQSNDVTRYYYGVRAAEATAARPVYSPGAATSFFAGANIIHPLSDRWTLFALVNFEKLSSEISDSPIVDAGHRALLISGIMYNF